MAKQDYIDKNRQWLADKASQPGVESIGAGVLRKVIKAGNGPKPNRSSVVTVHYTGKLINGKQFDSSRGGVAPAFRLRELIPGWNIALTQMPAGSRWELYIPPEQGYGKRSLPGIPGGSTLIFDIELISVN